jgi:Pro-kumamolisin, activation domain
MRVLQRFNRPSILQPCRQIAFATVLLLGFGLSIVTVALGAGNGNSFAVSGNTPGFVAKATDLGPLDPNTVIAVTVWLNLHNEAQLDKLVAQQQQRGSGQYHDWITQDQFNASFGSTSQELNSVQNYLNAKGLSTVFPKSLQAYEIHADGLMSLTPSTCGRLTWVQDDFAARASTLGKFMSLADFTQRENRCDMCFQLSRSNQLIDLV